MDMQPKRISLKKIRTNGVLASKNTLKTPPWTIFKWGGSETPHGIRYLRNPAPLGTPIAKQRNHHRRQQHLEAY